MKNNHNGYDDGAIVFHVYGDIEEYTEYKSAMERIMAIKDAMDKGAYKIIVVW